jgi:hypothetical protein
MKDTVFEFAKQSPIDIFLTEDGRRLMRYIDMPSHDITWYIDMGVDGWERMDLNEETWFSLNRGAAIYEGRHVLSVNIQAECNCYD